MHPTARDANARPECGFCGWPVGDRFRIVATTLLPNPPCLDRIFPAFFSSLRLVLQTLERLQILHPGPGFMSRAPRATARRAKATEW